VIAVDASAAMLRSARARLEGVANVDIRRGELEALPIEDGSLDIACLVLVLPYLAEPGVAVAEAARALKPGGKLLLTDMLPHDRAEYRQTMGHLWQGFQKEDVLGWMSEAGLAGGRLNPLPPDPDAKGPMLFTAVGVKR
jgi:ArsR family transcriptional regulator